MRDKVVGVAAASDGSVRGDFNLILVRLVTLPIIAAETRILRRLLRCMIVEQHPTIILS